jgi:hypothetical protein
MKRLTFLIGIVLLCSCANSNNKELKKHIEAEDTHAKAITRLQDSTVTSVFLGLKLGMPKDSVISYLTALEQEDKIQNLKATTLMDDSNYRCTELFYHGDSYKFKSKINVKVDSSFFAFNADCTIDFYKNLLYSIVIDTYPSVMYNAEIGWNAIKHMYEEKYGIGFTTNSTREYASGTDPEIWEYSAEIRDCMSFITENTIWTTSNVQIILADKKAKIKIDEYNKDSFDRLYKRYKWEFGNNERGLIARLESELRLQNTRYDYSSDYLLIYKDIKLHNEIIKIQQIALEKEERLKAEEKRRKEIADSVLNEKVKVEYQNQSI